VFSFVLRIKQFTDKYWNIISLSTYADILKDLQNGIDALNSLVGFFADNMNGGLTNFASFISNFVKMKKKFLLLIFLIQILLFSFFLSFFFLLF
jgi:hypothetical protein